jgi:nucleotide-binding universal stress UspA family protein
MERRYSTLQARRTVNERTPDPEPTTRLLVPVDLSASTTAQFDCAKQFAKHFNAVVDVLHVVHLNIVGEESGVPRSGLIQELMGDARQELQRLITGFWEADLVASIVIREGRPDQIILQEAHVTHACLVIMGARQRVGLSRLFRRHTLARVIRYAPCPVVTVRIADPRVQRGPASLRKRPRQGELNWCKRFLTRRAYENDRCS